MSVTYTEDRGDTVNEETFVPIYARRGKTARKSNKGVKTWMILAPIGAVFVLGGAAAMFMGGQEEAVAPAPLEAATAPVLPAAPLPTEVAPAPLEVAATPVEAAPPPAAPAPVAREAAPVRRAAPAPAARRAEPVASTPRVETPAEPTGLRPYSASPAAPSASPSSPATSTLNTAPAAPATPAPAPREPVISTQPLG